MQQDRSLTLTEAVSLAGSVGAEWLYFRATRCRLHKAL